MVAESLVLTYKLNLIMSTWVSRRNTVDRILYCLWFQGLLGYEDMFPIFAHFLTSSPESNPAWDVLSSSTRKLSHTTLPWTLLLQKTFSLAPLIHLKSESELVSIHERKIPK